MSRRIGLKFKIFASMVITQFLTFLSTFLITVHIISDSSNSNSSGQEHQINGRGILCADHATPYIRKKLTLRRQAAVARSV
jgi:hypothetical protein